MLSHWHKRHAVFSKPLLSCFSPRLAAAQTRAHLPRLADFLPCLAVSAFRRTALRVGIALAMLLHPSLLLADEPTSALDVVSQAQVLRELQALQQKEQTGMVLVTHNLAVLEQMADRVAVLKDGNIVEQGETRTVFDHPKDEYTKNLLAAVPGRGKNDA